jgi:hypothetical protein
MTRPLICILLAAMALCADPPPPDFSFAADSLTATVTRIGGKAPAEPDSIFPALPCDTTVDTVASGPAAWFEVEINDKRAGTDVRFPLDERALRRSLRIFCREDGKPAPARIAAMLRGMSSRMRVRMRPSSAESGK